MAFPFPITSGKPKEQLTAADLQGLRQAFIDKILLTQPNVSDDRTAEQLSQIARILGQTAGNEPTIYDNGSTRSSATSTANALTLQVERALTQVLGRTPGRGSDGFVTALNSAFPTGADGTVMTSPARSVVSLYSPDAEGLSGQLSVEQANLYRQASLIGNDALKVLDGLRPFNPTADLDAIEALKALIRSQIRSLIDEFGRLDEPRKERVESFLNTLLVFSTTTNPGGDRRIIGGSIFRLGQIARLITLNLGRDTVNGGTSTTNGIAPVTVDDETQVAGYELLINYVTTLRNIWLQYAPNTAIELEVTGRYSERLSRTSIMLPVISDSNTNFMTAMDSVGFTESERRSDAALFTTLEVPPDSVTLTSTTQSVNEPSTLTITTNITLPDMTVNDFDEWVERFTSLEAPSLLSSSGQFGLDFVTDQADTLFWTIAAVLYAVTPDPNDTNSSSPKRRNQLKLLGRILSFQRVQQTLSELVFQLDTLADLGVGSTSAKV
jgi:hypothetical protein